MREAAHPLKPLNGILDSLHTCQRRALVEARRHARKVRVRTAELVPKHYGAHKRNRRGHLDEAELWTRDEDARLDLAHKVGRNRLDGRAMELGRPLPRLVKILGNEKVKWERRESERLQRWVVAQATTLAELADVDIG
jgi:hypothetical protein